MNQQRFEQLLDAYGADPDRWPEAERAAALDWCRDNPGAQNALDMASELDGLIAPAALSPRPSDMLMARLARAVPAPAMFDDWKHVAAAAALALAVGIGGGYFGGAFVPASESDDFYEIAFDGLDSELEFDWEGGA